MKKKVIFGVFALALITINLAQSVQYKSSGISLKSLVNLALADSEETGTETLQRIKTSCNCYKNNKWTNMSITECEAYTWFPPMARTTCKITSCNSGSSCK